MSHTSAVRTLIAAMGVACAALPARATPATGPGEPVHDYRAIDSLALAVPRSAAGSLESLAAHLARPARSDREKARAIYRWITANVAYDSEGYLAGDYGDMTPAGVLRRRQAVCEGYAALYAALAGLAGLEVASISGYAKGWDYVAGARFDKINHAWNAVRLDGRWHLVDSTWGAGYIDRGRFVPAFTDYFFLTPPEQLVFTHLPRERAWQLLDPSLSRRDFEKQIHVRPALFRLGFPADAIRSRMRGKAFAGLPEAWDQPGSGLRVLAAPIDRRLEAGIDQRFSFELPGAGEVVVINAGKWHRLERVGGVHSGVIRAAPGQLFVSARLPATGAQYATVLLYDVVAGKAGR